MTTVGILYAFNKYNFKFSTHVIFSAMPHFKIFVETAINLQ